MLFAVHANDSTVGDEGTCQQKAFELGWCDLETCSAGRKSQIRNIPNSSTLKRRTLVLDQFFGAVHDRKVASASIAYADISSHEPAVFVDRLFSSFLVLVVAAVFTNDLTVSARAFGCLQPHSRLTA